MNSASASSRNEIVIVGGQIGGEAIDFGMSESGHFSPYCARRCVGPLRIRNRSSVAEKLERAMGIEPTTFSLGS